MIRVMVTDRVRLISEVISAALEGEPDLEVVGVAASAEETLEQLERHACEILVVGTSLPDGGAFSLIEQVHRDYPHIRPIVLGMPDAEAIIIRFIEVGAAGYTLVHEPLEALIEQIRAVSNQQAFLGPEMAAAVMERIAVLSERLTNVGMQPEHYAELTEREREVLELVASGLSNQEIADQLVIGLGTVKNHIHNIFEKLNVSNRQDAAIFLSLLQQDGDLLT